MDDKTVGESINIGHLLRFQVVVGEKGKYIWLYKRQDDWQEQSIALNGKVWRKLCVKIEELDLKGNTGQESALTMSAPFKTESDTCMDSPSYLNFYDGKVLNPSKHRRYINITAADVIELREKAHEVTSILSRAIVYRRKTLMGEEWHLVRDAVKLTNQFPQLEYNLCKLPSPRALVLLLTAYKMSIEIHELQKKTCRGCKMANPTWTDHREGGGCCSQWEDALEAHIPAARTMMDITPWLAKVNAQMGWTLKDSEFKYIEIFGVLSDIVKYDCDHQLCVDPDFCVNHIIDNLCQYLD